MTTDATVSRPLALVTGASGGIGYELAAQFAEHDFDVVINSEDTDDRLEIAAEQLRGTGADVVPVHADLRTAEGVERLYAAVRATGRPLVAAALNAGVGRGGRFVDVPLPDSLGIVDLNVRSTVHLARLVLADMVAADDGRVLFTSSIASTQPGPYQSVYNASKSFVQSFGEAVADELKDTGVSVTVLMPGPTDTDFFDRAGLEDTRLGRSGKDDPATVARQGFEALMKGDEKRVAGGVRTRAMAASGAVLPDKLKAATHRRMAQPQGDRDES